MKIKSGSTRIVLCFDNFVIKIPNFNYSHNNFLQRCCANWREYKYYNYFKNHSVEGNLVKYVSPSYFCSWFGLIQIQAKCEELKRDLTEEEKELYKPLCWGDNKKENFGWYNNKLVCLDYP